MNIKTLTTAMNKNIIMYIILAFMIIFAGFTIGVLLWPNQVQYLMNENAHDLIILKNLKRQRAELAGDIVKVEIDMDTTRTSISTREAKIQEEINKNLPENQKGTDKLLSTGSGF